MNIKPTLFTLVFLFSCASVFGQFATDQTYPVLNIPGSARIGALGGSYMAVQDNDLELGIYNPSVLDSVMHNTLSMGYVNYFSNVNMGYAALARYSDSLKTTFAGSMRFMSYGRFEEYDPGGQEIGSFYAGDLILTAGAGRSIDTNWRVGANVKIIYSAFEKFQSFGLAADLSATYYNPERRFTAVWIVKNVGTQLKGYTSDNREKLPAELQMGISKQLKHAPFRFSVMAENLQTWDLTYDNDNEEATIDPITGEVQDDTGFEFGDQLMRHLVFGGEILFTDNLHFRFGYNYRRRQEMKVITKPGMAGMSLGVGFKLKRFNLSYARSTYHISGASNHFSLSTKLW